MPLSSSCSEEQAERGFPGGAGQCTRRIHPAVRGGYLNIELIKSAGKRVCHMRLERKLLFPKLGPVTGLSQST